MRGRLTDGGSNDFWLDNSVMRRATLTLIVTDAMLEGTIDDALDGPSGTGLGAWSH